MSPGRADPPVVRRHLATLRSALPILHRHAGVSPQALNADPERRWSVERGLQLCAQNSLDIATHLASTLGLGTSEYASAIDRLVEAEVLPAEFGARFRAVAGLRDIPVPRLSGCRSRNRCGCSQPASRKFRRIPAARGALDRDVADCIAIADRMGHSSDWQARSWRASRPATSTRT